MQVVRFPMHGRERLVLCLCLLSFHTVVRTLPKLSRMASQAVGRHDVVLPQSLQPRKTGHLSSHESEEHARVAALFASKSTRQRTRLADLLPSLHPISKAQSANAKQRQPHTKAVKHFAKLPDTTPPLRLSFRPGSPTSPEACIIPDVCLAYSYNEERTFIPATYRPHLPLLRRCIHNRPGLEFYNRSAPSSELRSALQRRYPVDLIGVPLTSEFWSHFPHWALEYVKHLAAPASLFLRPQPPSSRWRCSAAGTGALSPCGARPPPLTPKLVLSELAGGRPRGWIRSFLRMLHATDVVWLPDGEPLPQKPPLRCFRSLLVSARAYDASDGRLDALLRAARVRRGRVAGCRPRIVFIARSPEGKIDRTIPESSVRRLADELARQMPAADVEVVRGLGGMSLSRQRGLFQRADVLVTVHGAEMANLIFARRGASVVEIFPFAYYFPFFRPMIESVGAEHVRIVAKPDAERFLHCLENRARKELPDMREADRGRIMQEFFDLVDDFEGAGDEEGRSKAGMYSSKNFAFRLCSRAQMIAIDPVEIAAVAVKEARRKCAVAGKL